MYAKGIDRYAMQVYNLDMKQARSHIETYPAIAADYVAGMSQKEIAAKYQIHRGTIRSALRREGVERRSTAYDPNRRCQHCGERKPLEEFYADKRKAGGRGYNCKPCCAIIHQNRSIRLKSRDYGVPEDVLRSMYEAQRNLCAICNKPCASRRRLAVDHDHETGRVRALLCGRCNGGLGLFGDNPHLLEAAAAYIRKWDATNGRSPR